MKVPLSLIVQKNQSAACHVKVQAPVQNEEEICLEKLMARQCSDLHQAVTIHAIHPGTPGEPRIYNF